MAEVARRGMIPIHSQVASSQVGSRHCYLVYHLPRRGISPVYAGISPVHAVGCPLGIQSPAAPQLTPKAADVVIMCNHCVITWTTMLVSTSVVLSASYSASAMTGAPA
jgi:hypothetical protein